MTDSIPILGMANKYPYALIIWVIFQADWQNLNIIKYGDIWQFEEALLNPEELVKSLSAMPNWKPYNNDGGGSTLNAKAIYIDKTNYQYKKFIEVFSECINNYTPALNKNISKEHIDSLQFMTRVYFAGSYMSKHYDKYGYLLEDGKPTTPIFTSILYLNEDYQGGELFFTKHDLTIKPKAGTLIMFPSFENHLVNKIISGERYMTQTYVYEKQISEYGEKNETNSY